MIFEKMIRLPSDRIAVLIGKNGKTKLQIENTCSVTLDVDSQNGEILISSNANIDKIQPFKAAEIVSAIGRGFSPKNAMALLKDENALHIIDLRKFAGKSPSHIGRIKGRIIGQSGKARRNMENLSGTSISVYGRTVAIIGNVTKLKLVVDAISILSNGSMHSSVYGKLESARRHEKAEKTQLWENQNVF